MNNVGNILLNQIISDNSLNKFKEFIPSCDNNNNLQILTKEKENIYWAQLDLSLNIIVNNKFKDTNIYYDLNNYRLGVGRFPLFNYKIDLAVPKNTLMTAFHIGDGSFGFSMGNGTTEGFIPEIIGIGSDENDAGLYFVGVAGTNQPSDIPLIILDGRSAYNTKLRNRPILGITSAKYHDYAVKVDADENLIVKGHVNTEDILLNNISLLSIISNLQSQIDELKSRTIKLK